MVWDRILGLLMGHTKQTSRISLQEIIDYCTCPLKLSQRLDGNDKLTGHDLFVKAGREAVYSYFNALAQGYYMPTAMSRATKEFDRIWVEHQHLITYDRRKAQYSGRLLVERLASMYDPKQDEVVAVNFPIELALTKNLIITDSIDVLLINKKSGKGGKRTIRAISTMDLASNDNERYMDMRAGIFKMAIQSYLGQQTKRHYTYEIRSFNSADKVITPKLNQRHDMVRLATNVMKGIKHKVYYPTTSKETCKQCHMKTICSLSLLK